MPSQSLPVYVFGAVLTKISELCLVTGTNLVDVVSMIRLSKVLLRNAPEGLNIRFFPRGYSPVALGTMRVTQKHTTSSFHLFLNRQDLWRADTYASLEICRFISSVCTERVGGITQFTQ